VFIVLARKMLWLIQTSIKRRPADQEGLFMQPDKIWGDGLPTATDLDAVAEKQRLVELTVPLTDKTAQLLSGEVPSSSVCNNRTTNGWSLDAEGWVGKRSSRNFPSD